MPRPSGSHLNSDVNLSSKLANRLILPLDTPRRPIPPNALVGFDKRRATCFPSGDQATEDGVSDVGLAVCNICGSLPSRLTAMIWYLPASGTFACAKAMRRPSGEKLMSLS